MKTVEFTVIGMTCDGCENSVKRVVKQLPDIDDVVASYKEKKVIVYYHGRKVNEKQIADQIKKLGYKVEVKND